MDLLDIQSTKPFKKKHKVLLSWENNIPEWFLQSFSSHITLVSDTFHLNFLWVWQIKRSENDDIVELEA